ncbi:hypothetical protein FN846DRAFT_394320 [Sphaerosporella brunnea]|uniref:SUI1 domain-containing protein n=1 Tax=Sphaerosporella brunnea TaxID=1250544 RepID=A0A5J5F5R3_9PEZI|nr:hypothetical protein FN846DRAFT_394320 [Sphaerosporella brunnea]
MFKKKPSIKAQAPLRSSDRRKIAQQIIHDLSCSPSSTDDGSSSSSTEASLRNQLLPDGSSSAKFTTTHGPELTAVSGNIYFGTHADEQVERPLWVRVDRQSPELSPTVFTLWKNPTLLPLLHTHENVVERLYDGADLMTPGLIGPPFPEGAKAGTLVGIASSERPTVPVAVGVCEIDIAALEKAAGEKGRAVKILHWVGDELYRLGGSSVKVPEALEITGPVADAQTASVTDTVGKLDIAEGKKADEVEENKCSGEEEIRQLDTEEIDDAFYNAALYGFYDYCSNDKVSALEFPLSSSAFISTLVHPYLPPASHFPPHNLLQNDGPHPSLQLKKTSWKNTAKFLKHLHTKQLVMHKIRGGGESVVMNINWQSSEVQSFTPYKLPQAPKEHRAEASMASGGGEKGGTIKIEALYRPNGKAIKFFTEINEGTKDFYTASDLKSLLNGYIETNSLAQPTNKRLIKLDPVLSNALFASTPADTNELAKSKGIYKRDQLAERLITTCAPYYRVIGPSGEEQKPKAGQPPKVSVVLEKRQGKKTVTRIFGLESFGVDPKGLAEELQKVCAGSATVCQAVGLKPGLLEVMVQGSQSKVVEKVLEKRGVPSRFLTVLDKTSGKK